MSDRSSDFAGVLTRGFVRILHRPPSPVELEAFARYLTLLLQWNRSQRLTGYREPERIAEKLFLDSLLFLRWIDAGPIRLLDLGAGAGVPGLPIKIVEPQIKLTLLEARRRRVSFLLTAVRGLQLEEVRVLHGRAEVLIRVDPSLAGAFDAAVTRGAGPLPTILPLALLFLKPGGHFVASGPPLEKRTPLLPPEIPHEWVTVPALDNRTPRRFLVVTKS